MGTAGSTTNARARTFGYGLIVAASAALWLVWGAGSAMATPPVIVGEGISGVGETDATLEATIIPGHDEREEWSDWPEAGGAWYQFQLAQDPAEFWPEVTCPEKNPEGPKISCFGATWSEETTPAASDVRRPGDLPTRRLFGSSEPKSVSLDLGAVGVTLEPQTTYYFRVIAVEVVQTVDTVAWKAPPVYGETQKFVTGPIVPEPEMGGGGLEVPPPLPQLSPPKVNGRHRCQPRRHRHRRAAVSRVACSRRAR